MPLIKCPACKKDISSNATACPSCGESITNSVAKAKGGVANPKDPLHFLFLVVAVLIILGIILFVITSIT